MAGFYRLDPHGRSRRAAMYEAVGVSDRSTPARFASTASAYGYGGVVFRDEVPATNCEDIEQAYNVTAARGTTVEVTDRDRTGRAINAARSSYDVVIAATTDPEMQRFLAQRERLDVLSPGGPFKHTTGNAATAHGIAIEIDLAPVLRTTGADRVRALRDIRRQVHVIETFDLLYVVTTHPETHLEMRAPRELAALESHLGFTEGGIQRGLATWESLVERARQQRDDRFIEPGVRRIDYDADDR